MVVIKQCTCKHKFQDERYGKGNRVHNVGKAKTLGMEAHVCTVCGKRTEARAS
jgi:hypothetical protein